MVEDFNSILPQEIFRLGIGFIGISAQTQFRLPTIDDADFRFTHVVVAQQVNLPSVQQSQEIGNRPKVGRGIGKSGNQRQPELHRVAVFNQQSRVTDDPLVPAAHILAVPLCVHEFQVEIDQVQLAQNWPPSLKRERASGFHVGMQPMFSAQRQHAVHEIRIQRRFTAGKRDTAAAPIIRSIGYESVQQLFGRQVFAQRFQGVIDADLGAFAAQGTVLVVNTERVDINRVVGTNVQTMECPVAAIRIKPDHRSGLLRFRVLAPDAVQVAALQKNQRANSRAVVDGKALDVYDRRDDGIVRIHDDLVSLWGSGNDFPLHLGGQINEIGAVTRDPHQQVSVAFRVLYRIFQFANVEHIDLDLHATLLEITGDQRPENGAAIGGVQGLRVELEVQVDAVAEACVIQPRHRIQRRSGSQTVRAVHWCKAISQGFAGASTGR